MIYDLFFDYDPPPSPEDASAEKFDNPRFHTVKHKKANSRMDCNAPRHAIIY